MCICERAYCCCGVDQPTTYNLLGWMFVACRTSIDCEIDAILKDLPNLEKDTVEVGVLLLVVCALLP